MIKVKRNFAGFPVITIILISFLPLFYCVPARAGNCSGNLPSSCAVMSIVNPVENTNYVTGGDGWYSSLQGMTVVPFTLPYVHDELDMSVNAGYKGLNHCGAATQAVNYILYCRYIGGHYGSTSPTDPMLQGCVNRAGYVPSPPSTVCYSTWLQDVSAKFGHWDYGTEIHQYGGGYYGNSCDIGDWYAISGHDTSTACCPSGTQPWGYSWNTTSCKWMSCGNDKATNDATCASQHPSWSDWRWNPYDCSCTFCGDGPSCGSGLFRDYSDCSCKDNINSVVKHCPSSYVCPSGYEGNDNCSACVQRSFVKSGFTEDKGTRSVRKGLRAGGRVIYEKINN